MKTRISRAFKDISLSFNPHPVTNDLTVIKNENAIKKSVRNLVQTIPGERFFNSILGTDIRSSLFDFVDFGTASVIEKQIQTTIENFEPRVENVRCKFDTRDNSLDVIIFYNIKNGLTNQELQLTVNRTR